jgi:selenium-binding protein 1
MNRREFLQTSAALAALPGGSHPRLATAADTPGFASPAEAIKAPREKLLFVACTYANTGIDKPDYLAVVDADPASPKYSQVVHRLSMTKPGDELHHYGWNICSSCHGKPGDRRYLIVPGLKSSRIHVIDAKDPLALKVHKVIEPEEVKKLGLSAPHTVHCLPTGEVMLSMLGDAEGNGHCGFLLLNPDFSVKGRWDKPSSLRPVYNYDFWYQPRHNVMISTEFAAPNTYLKGFDPKDVEAGKYGTKLHVWNWTGRTVNSSIDLGDAGRIPLELRFCHNPDSPEAFVGAALSSAVFRLRLGTPGKGAGAEPPPVRSQMVVQVDPVQLMVETDSGKVEAKTIPGLITDILVSMDDKFLYLSNWLHGDLRQYDITDPEKPKLVGQLFLGGVIGKAREFKGKKLGGGPQMLQLSLDGKRLYVTNSLLSPWDNQFYPDMAKVGSWMLQIDCDTDRGGLTLNERFHVDFGAEPDGPSRAHEVRYPGGDCSSDIFS